MPALESLDEDRLGRRGASLIELIVAMTVIAIGMTAVSGTMTLSMRQAGIAAMRSDQAAVQLYAAERLKGLPFDSVADGSTEISGLSATWTVVDSADSKVVTIVTSGGEVHAGLARFASDTSFLRIVQP